MSRRDESDSGVQEVLQQYEEAEAVVLRRELVAFLKSDECRAVLEQTVQKPIETIVQSALGSSKFQEQIRDAVIRSLQPDLLRAVQTAAANALKDVRVTIPEETQVRMREQAEQAIRHALGPTPASASPTRPAGTSLRVRVLAGVGAVVLIAAGWAVYYFVGDSPEQVARPFAEQGVTSPEPGTVLDPAPAPESQPSALLEAYRVALGRAGAPDLPQPAAAELQCVANAIGQVERSGAFHVAALRASLNGCAATNRKPARGASRIIAAVQAQLSEESHKGTCSDLRPVTIDGLHGGETSGALTTYVRCTAPAGVPEKLDTLGDYAAVGVYFIHNRMRDGNDLR